MKTKTSGSPAAARKHAAFGNDDRILVAGFVREGATIDGHGVRRDDRGWLRHHRLIADFCADLGCVADVEVLEQRCNECKIDAGHSVSRCSGRGVHLGGDGRSGRSLGFEVNWGTARASESRRDLGSLLRSGGRRFSCLAGCCLAGCGVAGCMDDRRGIWRRYRNGDLDRSGRRSGRNDDPALVEHEFFDQLDADHVFVTTRNGELLGVIGELDVTVEENGNGVDQEPAEFRVGVSVDDVTDLDVLQTGLDHLDCAPLHHILVGVKSC